MLTYFGRPLSTSRHQNQKIKQIPHLVNPQKISQLNFSHNDIRLIPPHITSLFNLQIIDLSHNKITKIQNIYHIKCLKLLNLSHNLITYIPQEISFLEEVENIDLSYNRIAMINNIKILKQFVEMRMVVRQGFVEISLEGNDVLKKKGCREMYKKWMNPNYSDCNRYSQAKIIVKQNDINLTKKRNSKSLQFAHTFRNHNTNSSFMETNRTFKVIHQPAADKPNYHHQGIKNSHILQSTEKINVNNIRSEEFSNQKQKSTTKIVPAKSQIMKRQLGMSNLSEMSQQISFHEIGNLGEWFCVCIDKLNDLKQGFNLMSQNQDIRAFDLQVKQKLVEECLYARQLVNLSLDIIRSTIDNSLSKQAFQQYLTLIEVINQKIKKYHHQILIKFKQKDHLPIKFYRPWVIYVKKLKQIIQALPLKVTLHQANYARQQEIKQLSSISPEKDAVNHSHSVHELLSNKKKCLEGGQLNGKLNELLFSKNQDQLLLSVQKVHQNSSEKIKQAIEKGYQMKASEECDYCLMLKWQNNKHKVQIISLQQKLATLQKQKESNLQTIQVLQKFKQKYLNLTCKQQLIIQQLQDLRPSTYQNILLQQAKTIQYMLNVQPIIHPLNLKSNALTYPNQNQKPLMIQSYNSRQFQKNKFAYSNTNLSSTFINKDKTIKGNIVSEFSIEDGRNKESNNRSSYFKNKNIVTTINRTGDEPKSKDLTADANRYQSDGNHRQEIIVSQFNSQANHSVDEVQSYDRFQHHKDASKNSKSFIKQKHVQHHNQSHNDKNPMHYSINSVNSDLLKNQIVLNLQKTQNDRILISETSSNKNHSRMSLIQQKPKNKQEEQIKMQLLSNLLAAKLTTSKSALSSKHKHQHSKNSISKNTSNKSSSIKQSNNKNISSFQYKQNRNSQNHSHYNLKNKSYELLRQRNQSYNEGHRYVPMQSTETESYKQYMKYHLRNNIIDVLTKKNNDMPEYNQYRHLTKSQKVITKQHNHKKQSSSIIKPSQPHHCPTKTIR